MRKRVSLTIFTHVVVGLSSFSLGVFIGLDRGGCGWDNNPAIRNNSFLPFTSKTTSSEKSSTSRSETNDTVTFDELRTFHQMFAGAYHMNAVEFLNQSNLGVPIQMGDEKAIILYNSPKALPKDAQNDPLKNCRMLKIILHQTNRPRECVALVPQYESFHLHRVMRVPKDHGPVSPKHPFRVVSRTNNQDNLSWDFPDDYASFYSMLGNYLTTLDSTLAQLRPIAESVARNNTVVAMVCNQGQSELLLNFVCQGHDTSQFLIFATDMETFRVAKELDLSVFLLEVGAPKSAAQEYMDESFRMMMVAKLYCAHLISELGMNFLFQDVDVVWKRNPLSFFQTQDEYDIYFQDDGGRTDRYATYFPNSGFFFSRYNERTRGFWSSFMRNLDLVLQWRSHQQAMNFVLQDYINARGLRIKVFGLDEPAGDLFPCGYHYHFRPDFMRSMIAGEKNPFIFHYSFTRNKFEKIAYLHQMEEWTVDPKCYSVSSGILLNNTRSCCLKDPLFSCFYRDKPSVRPCRDSEPFRAGEPSFW